jgi:hypothetical protein
MHYKRLGKDTEENTGLFTRKGPVGETRMGEKDRAVLTLK